MDNSEDAHNSVANDSEVEQVEVNVNVTEVELTEAKTGKSIGRLQKYGQQQDPKTGKFLAKPKTQAQKLNAGKLAVKRIRRILEQKDAKTGLTLYEQATYDLIEIIKTAADKEISVADRAKFATAAVNAYRTLSERGYGKQEPSDTEAEQQLAQASGIRFVIGMATDDLPKLSDREPPRKPTFADESRKALPPAQATVLSVITNEPQKQEPTKPEKSKTEFWVPEK